MAETRYRATVVIFKDNKVLLVRDKHRSDFSFPGGGFERNETTIQAGIREATQEELSGIRVLSAERIRKCDLDGKRAYHKVCLLNIEGNPHVRQHHEISEVLWWDMKTKLKVQNHVRYILRKLGRIT